MSAPAIIAPPAAPIIPATAVAAPIAAPVPVTEHSQVDRIQNQIAAKLAAARVPAPPVPGMPVPLAPPLAVASAAAPALTPAAPTLPAVPSADPAVSVPAATQVAEIAPVEVDLASIDFDAPPAPTVDPLDPAAPVIAAPVADQGDLIKDLRDLLGQEDADKVLGKVLTLPRGKRMLEANKIRQELEKPPSEGGIGRFPTVEEIRDADLAQRSVTAMRFEFENDPLSFANNLFIANAETGRTFLGDPAKAAQVLEAIPQALFNAARTTQNPIYSQMIVAYSAPVFQNFFDHQYSQALAMPEESPQLISQYRAAKQDPPLLSDKIRMIDALQLSEFKAFGKPRPMTWTPGQPSAPAPSGPDPEKQQLLERLKAADARIAAASQQQLNSIVNQVESGGRTAAMSDVEVALKHVGVDKVYPASVIQSQQRDIYQELYSALPSQDPSGWQRYQIQLQQASRGQADPAAVAKTFRALFQNALRHSPQVRERLNDLVKGAKSNVDAQHQSRLQSQLRTEPNGAGVPAPSSVIAGQQLARQSGESTEDFYTRRIAAARQRQAPAPVR